MDSHPKRQAISVGSRGLQYFVMVAELGSISRAAVNLRITQPALSRQIKRLEDQLGVEVLLRYGRGVRLTPAGERLYQEALSLQRQFHQLCAEIAQNATAPRGALTLAVTPTAGEILIPELVARYRKLYPMVELTIRQGYSDFVERMMESGHADLGVFPTYGRFVPTSPQLVTKRLLVEREFLIGPAGASKMKTKYRFKDLVKMPLIVPVRGNGLRLLLESLAAERGLSLNIVAEVDGMTLIKALVRKNVGYTILPLHSPKAEPQTAALQASEILDPKLERVFVVAWHGGRALSRAASLMLPLISSTTKELISTGAWPNVAIPSA